MSAFEASAPAAPPVPASFPPKELRQACDEIVARYPTRMAACLPVLHLAQKHFGGWISPEVEAGVAAYLEVSDSHIRGLLTFYAMFNTRPSGRHEVWVCRTLTCWLRGAAGLRRTALAKAGVDRCGVESPDGRFLVKDMECLGLCEVAPAVFIDGAPHTEVTTESLEQLMDACE
ncbi:MAG: NAD(P)H-dependent oxidoreductase subunit E [Planctomycetota bacterium]|nr:NAD(P)H-dependent oxidoreductase subunit E [Planctomycetota bacterium]